MAIYEISSDQFRKINETSFSNAGLRERQDLQRLLRSQIEIVSPDILVIAEEFSQWEDSHRRIDLLGIDKDARLVVIELKRTEDGGHMELQAIRYAAMVSAMTFERAIEVYTRFLKQLESDEDARSSLLDFLEWDEPDEDRFAQEVRIVLVSAEFSKELTTSVIWLNESGLDIQCVRIKPYSDNGRILADIQPIIPLPEAEDYRVRIKEKQQKERASRKFNPDFTKYDVTVDGVTHSRLPKRTTIFTVVRYLIEKGYRPEEVASAVPWRKKSMFRVTEGVMNSIEFIDYNLSEAASGGQSFEEKRFYCDEGELFHCDGKTYGFTNQWGSRFIESIEQLIESFPDESISYIASDQ
ncbi:hypothetical protein CA11_29310 [Gimesia maris]|uniref:hypothetical protein n=1 Tax=Gimesia maris TaxID=122 RepID=UPI0011896024|nr:hypothetical protein [Gimesia maris]QDU15111.1 hypothetical protein CA11_29310 [Gimesia maris]